jgi:tRNA-dihydrouridine synthase A
VSVATGRRGTLRSLSVAPMLDRTDRHFRYLLRGITRRTLLYSEMVTTGALLHGDRRRHLAYDPAERPLALQLGGDEPRALAACARMAADEGYDEVNLNVGCPSDRVQRGRFGACLMAEPDRVAEGVAAMRAAVRLPVTVKHRLGIDDRDRWEDLEHFVVTVAAAGCDRFTVHARKAWLSGLSPRENRDIPPLRHEVVHRLKRRHPQLAIELNGGIGSVAAARRHLAVVDAVMIGRAAYDDPFVLAPADRVLFGATDPSPTRREVVLRMVPYVERARAADLFLSHVTRHMLGLVVARPGARAWRRHLTTASVRPGAGAEVLHEALALLPPAVLDERPGGLEPEGRICETDESCTAREGP